MKNDNGPRGAGVQARVRESLRTALRGESSESHATTPSHTRERTPAPGLGMRIDISIMVLADAAIWS